MMLQTMIVKNGLIRMNDQYPRNPRQTIRMTRTTSSSNSLPWISGVLVVHPDQTIFDDHRLEHHYYCRALPSLRLALGKTSWPSRTGGGCNYCFHLFRNARPSDVARPQLGRNRPHAPCSLWRRESGSSSPFRSGTSLATNWGKNL